MSQQQKVEEEKLDVDVLIGKTIDEADKFIELNDVFYDSFHGKITEIRVVRNNGLSHPRNKDIRDSDGHMRLNVYIQNGIINEIESIG